MRAINKLIKGKSYSALPNLSDTFQVIFIWALKKTRGIQYVETEELKCDNTYYHLQYMNLVRSFNDILSLDNGNIYIAQLTS